jgi:DNA-binding winged helix-turn-helix (wHTH) protein/tetratricopeptide (TPR) repeat protein
LTKPSANGQQTLSEPVAFGEFVLHPDQQRLSRGGEPVALKPKVYDLLCLLMRHRDRVLSRAEIMDWLWPRQDIDDATLSQAVYELRRALGDSRWIHNLPRRGYRFAGEVRSVPGEARAAGAIAVLPLQSLGLPAGEDWLGLALADGLITALGCRLGGQLTVRALGAVLPLAEHPGSLPEKAELLKVDSIIEGAVRSAANGLEASLRLVRVADQAVLGAMALRGDAQALLDRRDELAAWVLDRLGLAQGKATPSPELDAEVEALYVKALACWHRFTVPAWWQAIEYLDKGLVKARDNPRLLALRANAWSALACLGGIRPVEGFARGRADIDRVLALAPELSIGHESMSAYHLFHDWDPALALQAADRAVEADPDSAIARHLRSLALSALGRLEQALAEAERARQLDPASVLLHNDVGVILHHGGRPAEAVEVLDAVIERDPAFAHAHYHKAMALADLGEPERGLEAVRIALRLTARNPAESGQLARLLCLAGRAEDYRRQRDSVLAAVEAGRAGPMEAVWAVLDAGDIEETVRWLERAIEARSRDVVLVTHLPALAALRRHPRVAVLLREAAAGTCVQHSLALVSGQARDDRHEC